MSGMKFYAGWTTAVVAATSLIRSELDAGTSEIVVSGASLSFRSFNAPYAMIEGFGYELDYPDLNEVLIVGPNIAARLQEAIDKFKSGYSYFQNIDPNQHFRNFDQVQSRYREIKQKMLDNFVDPVNAVVTEAKSMYQPTTFSDRPCVFAVGPCTQLLWPDGFASVYTLPENAYFQLPLPIVVVVYNPVNGRTTLDLVPFMPTIAAEAP